MNFYNSDKKRIVIHMSGLRIAEILLIIFLIVYIVLIFERGNSRNVDISVISEAITDQCQLQGLDFGDAKTMKRYFGLDVSAYDGFVLYTSDNLMNVDELLVVKIRDSSQLDELEDAVNERLKNQIRNFHGYGTNQEELLQNAIMQERGRYFFYAVSSEAEQWENVFLSTIE